MRTWLVFQNPHNYVILCNKQLVVLIIALLCLYDYGDYIENTYVVRNHSDNLVWLFDCRSLKQMGITI